jgi:hypothetical protein
MCSYVESLTLGKQQSSETALIVYLPRDACRILIRLIEAIPDMALIPWPRGPGPRAGRSRRNRDRRAPGYSPGPHSPAKLGRGGADSGILGHDSYRARFKFSAGRLGAIGPLSAKNARRECRWTQPARERPRARPGHLRGWQGGMSRPAVSWGPLQCSRHHGLSYATDHAEHGTLPPAERNVNVVRMCHSF